MNIVKVGTLAALFFSSLQGIVNAKDPECAPCGPTFCQSPAHAAEARAAKLSELKKEGYPQRLLNLVSLNTDCAAASGRGPDGFSLIIVQNNGDWASDSWTKGSLEQAKAKLAAGNVAKVIETWAVNYFCCCPENGQPVDELCYKKRSDYDEKLDLNTDIAIIYE